METDWATNADFLADPLGTRVGHANSRCSGEVETSNASDPLQEDRVSQARTRVVNRFTTIEIVNELWGRRNRKALSLAKGMIAADFLGDPTGTRVGHAHLAVLGRS